MIMFRKKRERSSPPPNRQPTIRPSLSLPDLTTPLLDPGTWEEIPYLPQTISTVTTTPVRGRGRAPSSVSPPSLKGDGDTPTSGQVQFHRPFTPWQVVNNFSSLERQSSFQYSAGAGFDRGRIRDSSATGISGISGLGERRGRRGKNKVLGRLNVAVVGGKGVGKSSFVNLLVDSLASSSKSSHSRNNGISSTNPNTEKPTSTPASPTVPGPPISAQSIPIPASPPIGVNVIIPPTKPTTRITARTIQVSAPGYERSLLRLIDTPGLELGTSDIQIRERERGVIGLLRMLEERFAETLREESRIIRRGPKADDDMVHLVIYLIDARSILRPSVIGYPTVDIDWASTGMLEEIPPSSFESSEQMSNPQVGSTDISIIRRLAIRANVLPVLTFIDALTASEREIVRSAVRRDLASAFRDGNVDSEGRGFGVFIDIDIDEDEEIEEDVDDQPMELDPRPPTPASIASGGKRSGQESSEPHLPFGVFAPETQNDDNERGFTRRYPWGEANVLDAEQSDFILLRDSVLGTHTKVLKTTTREILYERFRTERLLAKHAASAQGVTSERGRLVDEIQRV